MMKAWHGALLRAFIWQTGEGRHPSVSGPHPVSGGAAAFAAMGVWHPLCRRLDHQVCLNHAPSSEEYCQMRVAARRLQQQHVIGSSLWGPILAPSGTWGTPGQE